MVPMQITDREIPETYFRSMVQSLYSAPRVTYLASLILVGCTIYAGLATDSLLILMAACWLSFVTLVRILDVEIFRSIDSSKLEIDKIRGWETRYAVLSLFLFTALSGWFAAVLISKTPPQFDLMAILVIMGYLVSVTGRNHASKRVVNLQLIAAAPPVLIAMMFAGDGQYMMMTPLAFMFFALLASMAGYLRSQLFAASLTSMENEALAARFHTALNNMAHGLCMIDADRRIVVFNSKLATIFGHEHLNTVAKISRELSKHEGGDQNPSLYDLFKPSLRMGLLSESEAQNVATVMDECLRDEVNRTTTLTTQSGRSFEVTCSAMANGGGVALFEDITEQQSAQAQINHLAHFDSLTGLMNRSRMRQELSEELAHLGRDEKCAVLFLDLDKFKEVNDTLGHPVGDALLCNVAERLSNLLPTRGSIGRLGGDEFIIIVPGYNDREELNQLSKSIIDSLSEPFMLNGQQILIGVSIGIATAPRDSTETDGLIKRADVALYCSKSAGRGTWHFFEQRMEEAARARRQMEIDMRGAVERGEITVCFQPLVNTDSLKITTCEALVRWQHPERGIVSPSEFISVAEETGIINKIGRHVLYEACKACKDWEGNTRVAVNVSALQFHGDIDRVVLDALAETGLEPSRLEIEITESVFLQASQQTRQHLTALREAGVRIALDDFGTGYSSLSYLHAFPLDKVKLDRSFVLPIETQEKSRKLLEGVLKLCHALDLSIAVEGIETQTQMEMLQATGLVNEMQGYLFGVPVPGTQIQTFLQANAGTPDFAPLSEKIISTR